MTHRMGGRGIPAPRLTRLAVRLLAVAGTLCTICSPAFAPDKTVLEIGPGPKTMSEAEKALAPDPAAGSQHGVILVDETDRDDSGGADHQISRHLRAKVFSNEARGLADVEIPVHRQRGVLKRWWGWTLLPDGTVRELRQSELKVQEIARSGGEKLSILKGSLPGVVPGSIIDYGWVIRTPGVSGWQRVELQQSWPVREIRYRWTPWQGWVASYRVSRAENLRVDVTRDQRSVLVAGRDLPAAVEEPWMPPKQDSLASVTFYYRSSGDNPKEFWELEAKRMSRRVTEFCKEKPIRGALATMKVPDGADLHGKLKTVYDWIATNVRNTHLRTAEEVEVEADEDEDKPSRRTAAEVLQTREANGRELDYLFACFARALGAQAEVVMATDRTDHIFDAGLLSAYQFDHPIVAARAPGDPDEKVTFVDDGLGLAYGEVAWWVTGAPAFLADTKSPRSVIIRPSDPRLNVSESKTTISFDLEQGTAQVQWTRNGSGQHGLSERLRLRTMNPDERRNRLDELCGTDADMEISKAEAPALEDVRQAFRLECEATMLDAGFRANLSSYGFSFLGPWIGWVPELSAPTRVHPVVFQFPKIDEEVVEVLSPPGFEPAGAPAVTPLDSPFGHYALFVTATPAGYHVERVFSLTALGVPPQEYDALRKFLAEVHRADRTQLEFRRAGERR